MQEILEKRLEEVKADLYRCQQQLNIVEQQRNELLTVIPKLLGAQAVLESVLLEANRATE
jgi:hypothetical protein